MKLPDVVYVVRPTADDNEDLRYSLRTLKNVKHGKVFVYATPPAPRWLSSEVNVIEVPRTGHIEPFADVNLKLTMACCSGDVSDRFIFMNDDFFILHPLKEIPYWTLGLLDTRRKAYKTFGTYAKDLVACRNVLEALGKDTIDFETHAPIMFNASKLLSVVCNYPNSGHRRSFYGNIYNVKSVIVEEDFKVYTQTQFNPARPILSTIENFWTRHPEVAHYLRTTFSEPSKYER